MVYCNALSFTSQLVTLFVNLRLQRAVKRRDIKENRLNHLAPAAQGGTCRAEEFIVGLVHGDPFPESMVIYTATYHQDGAYRRDQLILELRT